MYKIFKKILNIFFIQKWELCILGISIAFIIINFIWLQLDTENVFWDDGWYLETSINLYNTLTHRGLIAFFITFENSLRIKAPLIALLPLPFYFIFGKSLTSALLSVFVLIPITSIYLYHLSEKFVSKIAALTSVIFLHSLPIILSVSRQFMVEYLEMTLIIMWIYYLFKSDYFRIKKYNIILGIIGGLGMLAKVVFPMFIIIPTFVIIAQRIIIYDKKKITKKIFQDIFPIIFLIVGITSTWYIYNAKYIGWYLFANSYGSVAKDYSNGPALDWKTILIYFKDLNNYGFSFYFISLFFITLSIFLSLVVSKKIFLTQRQKLFLGIVIAWFLFPFLNNTLAVTKSVRWMAPAMPAFVLLLVFFLDDIFKKIQLTALKIYAFFLFSLFAIFQALYGSFELTKLGNINIVYRDIFIFKKNTEAFIDYLHVPQKITFSHTDVINTIMKYTDGSRDIRNVLIATENKNINFNNFQYYSNLSEVPLHFYSGGSTQNNTDIRKIAQSKIDNADFIIYTSDVPSDFLNTINTELKKIIEKDSSLIPIGNFNPSIGRGVIYKKIKSS